MPSRGHCASFWCHVELLMSFWSFYLAILGAFWCHVVLYACVQMPSRGQCAVFFRHVGLLVFILKLLFGHFRCVLTSWWAFYSRPDAIPWPLCGIFTPCWAVRVHFEAVIWPFWERFGIMLCFMLVPRCHPVAIVHPFDAMSRCWCHFGAVIWLFWGHFDIMLCFMLASRCHTRGHCARFCRRVTLLGFIWRHRVVILGAFWHHTELYSRIHIPLCGHCAWFCYHVALLGFILTSWCALCSRPDPIVWPTRHTFTLCYAVEIYFGAVICPFWMHFGIMLRFRDRFWSYYLALWGAFWHHVVLYSRVQMPSRGQCARFCRHVGLLGFILKLLAGHFRCVLASWWAFCSRPDAIVWPICTIVLPCCAVGIHFDIMMRSMLAPRSHCVANLPYFYAMLRCWDLFWSCYLPILDAFWYHVVL